MAEKTDYGSWGLNHPVKSLLLFLAFGVAGGGLGAWSAVFTSETHHWISPDNVAAGWAMGMGGVLLGFGCGLLLVGLIDRWRGGRDG